MYQICAKALVSCLALCSLVGCGAGVFRSPDTTTPTPTPGTYPDLTGNWEFDVETGTGSGAVLTPFYKISGALTGSASSSNVTGPLQLASSVPNGCTNPASTLPLTGTVDSSGNVSFFLSPTGGRLSLYGSYNATLYEIFGIVNVAGGSCVLAQTSIQGYMLASLTGTWVGTFQNSGTGSSSTVTAVFTQSTSPSADGSYLLTGTVSSTGSCVGSFSFNAGDVLGGSFNSNAVGGTTVQPYFAGNLPRKGFSTIPFFSVNFPTCPSTPFTGALTRQ